MKYRKHRHPGVRKAGSGIYIIDFMDHNNKRRQHRFHGTESEAAKARRSILAKVDRIINGLELPPEVFAKRNMTLDQLWNIFEKYRNTKVKNGTLSHLSVDRSKNAYNAFINANPALKNILLSNLKTIHFEKFKSIRLENNNSPIGINSYLIDLRTLFNFAVRKEILKKSPMADVEYLPESDKEVRFLDDEELLMLKDAISEYKHVDTNFERDAKDLTLMFLYTGARESEILLPHFTWDCIKTHSITFPKTKRHKKRTIPLIKSVKAILDSRKVFETGPFQNIKNRYQIYRRVKNLLDFAHIENASTHTLRKTAGAWYYMATRDIYATSRFLGHSSVKMTEKHYSGLIESFKVEYSNAFEAQINSIMNNTGN